MRKLALVLGILLAPAVASAQTLAPYTRSNNFGAQLSGIALNASSATRTTTLTLNGQFASVVYQIDYTYSAATTVTMTCTNSLNGGSTYGGITITDLNAGTITKASAALTYTTGSASAVLVVELGAHGVDHQKCVFGGASAGSGDLVTVTPVGVVGG
jgi:hypothetical protein